MKRFSGKQFIQPKKCPFFYGYVVLLFGTAGVWFSLPGQTVGVSTFTDPVKSALGLSRDQFSASYMIGTLLSSLLISTAGRWFDRYGARVVAFGAALALSVSLLLASYVDRLSNYTQSLFIEHWLIPFILMSFIFFLFRFSGQGVLTMSSRNVIMKWFDRLRGRVNAFSSLSVALGFSLAPILIDRLIGHFGWDGAWRLMSLSLLIMALFIWIFYRDSPELFGLKPDGKVLSKSDKQSDTVELFLTPGEAFSTRAFWMYSLILSFNSFFITGFTFHVISIFETFGHGRDEAISIFVPIAVVSVLFSLVFNFISDWVRLKKLLYVMIFGGFMGSIGIVFLSSAYGIYFVILGSGILGGLFSVLNAVAWPRLYGRKYLGAISGKAMSMIVMASALAPMVYSLSFTFFGNYVNVGLLGIGFMIFMLIASAKADNPRLKQPKKESL